MLHLVALTGVCVFMHEYACMCACIFFSNLNFMILICLSFNHLMFPCFCV